MSNKSETTFKFKQKSIRQLFEEEFEIIEIPLYQREYVWDDEQIIPLLDDLIDRYKDQNQHYFGIIAQSVKRVEKDDNYNKHRIIDGQQRITTSILLIYYLDKKINENENTNIFNDFRISDILFEIGANIREDILQIIKSQNRNLIPLKHSRIKKNYEIIEEYFKNRHFNNEELKEILKTFLDKFIFGILEYTIEKENEMLVFENLNSKGSPLDSFDLIRNAIILQNKDNDSKQNLIDFNSIVFNVLKDGYWRSEIKESKRGEEFEEFIKNYTKWLGYTKKYKSYKTYKNFEQLINDKVSNGDQFKEFLGDLRKYLILYLEIKHHQDSPDIGNRLWYRVIEQKNVHIPLAFELFSRFSHFNINNDKWDTSNKLIDLYMKVWASHIIKLISVEGTGQSLSNLVFTVIKLIKEGLPPRKIKEYLSKMEYYNTPSDWKFIESLKSPKKESWLSKSIIDIIETVILDQNAGENIKQVDMQTIEHIMPQDLSEWKNDLGYEEEKLKQLHSKCKDQIGNLIHLNNKQNTKISNKSFKHKVNEVYKKSSSILVTAKGLEKYGLKNICEYDQWTFDIIEERTEKLGKVIIDIMNSD
ncbi:DUF262 domain-containing protein [Metamycoplasma auris]|uniref:Uncharacterized protein with ParB-like and HNH nuclease domain n=1 Tax=Metamycoplasma auris TaxID=51363 RepID=A0A2W7G4D8_9BACT|nr:DUF262 domain-containing protein [Metamycoplasma auris]PZW01540.1 uncharacterized protein with ParB-like and HNH nuclease domain [Metamycoplasma auris]